MVLGKLALAIVILLAGGNTAAAQSRSTDLEVGIPRNGVAAMARYKEICGDHYAHAAARLAFLEAKLNLNDSQHPAWVKWQQWVLDAASKERDMCLIVLPKDDAMPNALDRETHMEKVLNIELQGLQSARPALEELYATLTPEQKATFDHQHWKSRGPDRPQEER